MKPKDDGPVTIVKATESTAVVSNFTPDKEVIRRRIAELKARIEALEDENRHGEAEAAYNQITALRQELAILGRKKK